MPSSSQVARRRSIGVASNAVPPRVAYWIWVVVVELVLLLCIRGTRRITKDPTLFACLSAMWLMYTPFYMEQYMGQLTFVMAAMTFAYAVAHLRGRPLASDAWWWLSVIVKQIRQIEGVSSTETLVALKM